MTDYRIKAHPILPITEHKKIYFYWNGSQVQGEKGDTIAAALFANGIRTFGSHPKDHSPQGIYCANGQCSQCLVLMNGLPVKACMELLREDSHITSMFGLPKLPDENHINNQSINNPIKVQVLIIGGGPAGLSAAIELGKMGIQTLLIDDKHRLGGKLVLQTHRFFGSIDTVYAGTRGIDIATRLEEELSRYPSVKVWLRSTALAIFSEKWVGILREGNEYTLIRPKILLVASGAREKFLAFKGNTLPGVYGAGAFQTLINRDLIKPASKIFIVGGGNVGLIAGYHALQAGIQVVGLVEALPTCGGYKVHKDKLHRLGVPIYTSHTIVSANGDDCVTSISIASVDSQFNIITGSEKVFGCDTILIAVGLDPVNEFYTKAKEYNLPVFSAGDAEEIAEASAAIFSGKIRGLEIGSALGIHHDEIPDEWYETAEILKSKPGFSNIQSESVEFFEVMPIIHCTQEIPCDPCASICPNGLIYIDPGDIRSLPEFHIKDNPCMGCEKCLIICPGLAITIVDSRKNRDFPIVSIPYEFARGSIAEGQSIEVTDTQGEILGWLTVKRVISVKGNDRTTIVMVQAPAEYASKIAGIRIQSVTASEITENLTQQITDETMICRCERVTAGEIRALIKKGYRDVNEIKSITRAGMGACGAKTCQSLIHRLFKEEGVKADEIVNQTLRPLFIEVPVGNFTGSKEPPKVAMDAYDSSL